MLINYNVKVGRHNDPLFQDKYYMKALNSRNQSDKKNNDLNAQQMRRVRAAIDAAIKQGLYETMVYESIVNTNIDLLQADGYQVFRRGGRMGENNYLIKWRAAK